MQQIGRRASRVVSVTTAQLSCGDHLVAYARWARQAFSVSYGMVFVARAAAFEEACDAAS